MNHLFLIWFIGGWLAFACTGLRMAWKGWKAGERWSLMLNATSFLVADYNRKDLRVLIVCFANMVTAVIVYNLMFFTKVIDP
jgi:hypothetical protein